MMRNVLPIAALLACASCMVGPDLQPPAIEAPDAFETQPEIAPESVDQIWWEGFNDPVLEDLIGQALENNYQIAAADANLQRSLALLRANRSDLFPTLDAFVDTQLNATFADDSDTSASASTGLAFGFDPDITGRNKRRIQAAEEAARAAMFQRQDLRRLITEAVSLEYVEVRRAEARLALLETSLDLQERTLEIVDARFEAGLSPALDVDRAASDLARTRAQRGRLIAARRDALFALSVLTGQAPSSAGFGGATTGRIPQVSVSPAIGVPADALRRRPDLRAAEAQFLAELAFIGVEQADLYPSIRLPGQVTARALSSGNPSESVSASLSSVLDIPLFDAGRRRAEYEAQQASADAALATYQATLLNVLAEVEGALLLIEAQQSQLADLSEAVMRGESAYQQLDALYREGLASFIDVLDAQRNLISSREAVVDTQADITAATIRLYVSLGLDIDTLN